jgi:NADH-quinone oxidoreductase subunit C
MKLSIPKPQGPNLAEVADILTKSTLPEPSQILAGIAKGKDNTFEIERANIIDACRRLHSEGFEHLSCITAVDWKTSWQVVYHIVRIGRKDPVTLKVTLPYKDPTIPSIVSVWSGAGWHERESYDLMGIKFIGNPDLRRILLPADYEGFPLRKEVKHGNTS